MILDGIRYAFLTSSDEVIFLKLDIAQRIKNVNIASPGENPELEQVDVLKEAWLSYSDPIKHTDVLDEAKGTVSVRLALLYLLYVGLASDGERGDGAELCSTYEGWGEMEAATS